MRGVDDAGGGIEARVWSGDDAAACSAAGDAGADGEVEGVAGRDGAECAAVADEARMDAGNGGPVSSPQGTAERLRTLWVSRCARCAEAYAREGEGEFSEYCRGCLDYIFEQTALAPVSEMIQ